MPSNLKGILQWSKTTLHDITLFLSCKMLRKTKQIRPDPTFSQAVKVKHSLITSLNGVSGTMGEAENCVRLKFSKQDDKGEAGQDLRGKNIHNLFGFINFLSVVGSFQYEIKDWMNLVLQSCVTFQITSFLFNLNLLGSCICSIASSCMIIDNEKTKESEREVGCPNEIVLFFSAALVHSCCYFPVFQIISCSN